MKTRPQKPRTARFRNVFVVFMVLVAVPSLAISGFGILAIVDARSVAEARLKQSYAQKLRLLAADLATQMQPLAREIQEAPEGNVEDPGELAARLQHTADAQAEHVRALLPALSRRHFPPESAVVELVHDPLEDSARTTGDRFRHTLDAWVQGRAETSDLFRNDVITELRLPVPLDGYRLQARLLGDDLLTRQVRTTAVIYSLLLMVFYVALILGVVMVSVTMYREVQLGRLKTDFVSHVSHELRTPLTSIRMFLETLLLGRVQNKDEERECLEMCARETERLSGMIERVLDWAKVEAGKKLYQKRAVTAGDVAQRALNAFATQALEAPYTLSRDIQAPDAPLLVDPEAISDALINLLHNAFKYTLADKRIGLKVTAHGGVVEFSVTDNGVGIARRDRKKVFERFYRAEDLLSASTHGSGLGLALAKRMVEAHGGRITVESTPGLGSTFTVRLPQATPKQHAAALLEQSQAPS
jgi:signal transduction histidine kinase